MPAYDVTFTATFHRQITAENEEAAQQYADSLTIGEVSEGYDAGDWELDDSSAQITESDEED